MCWHRQPTDLHCSGSVHHHVLWVVSQFTRRDKSPFEFLVFFPPSVVQLEHSHTGISWWRYCTAWRISHSDCFRLTQLKQWIFKSRDISLHNAQTVVVPRGKRHLAKKRILKIHRLQAKYYPPPEKCLTHPLGSGWGFQLQTHRPYIYDQFTQWLHDWESHYVCGSNYRRVVTLTKRALSFKPA